MASAGRVQHNPTFASDSCCWLAVAENVGTVVPCGEAAERLLQVWMDSVGHRRTHHELRPHSDRSPADQDDPSAPGTRQAPGDPPERSRVTIRGLLVRQDGSRVQVVATLALGERVGCGTAEAPATRSGLWLGVGDATLEALDELVGSELRVGIDRITVASQEEPPSVRVLLTAVVDAREETLLGATLLHDDPAAAVMRATLDALNGRIEPLLRAARLAAAG